MTNEKKALSPEEASRLYGISKGTLANLRSFGKGCKYYKRGRRVIYKVDDFEAWLYENPLGYGKEG